MYRSKEHPFMIADVDRLVAGEDAGLECKTASAYNADKWTDGISRSIMSCSATIIWRSHENAPGILPLLF